MGIARPINQFHLKQANDQGNEVHRLPNSTTATATATATDTTTFIFDDGPATIEVNNDVAFYQTSTNAFILSVDEFVFSKGRTAADDKIIVSGLSTAQKILFCERVGRIDSKKLDIWNALHLIKKSAKLQREAMVARRILAHKPNINADLEIEDAIVKYLVKLFQRAKHWLVDISLVFDDHGHSS